MSDRIKVLIDTDAGIDDAHAILILLQKRYDVDVVGITTCHGKASVDQVCLNVLRLLKEANRLDIPVYRGSDVSLIDDEETRDPSVYHGHDGFGDVPDTDAPDASLIQKENAIQAMLRIANEHQDPSKTISEEEKTSLMIGSGEVDVSEDSTGKDAFAAGDVSQLLQGSGPPSSTCPTAGVIRYNSTPSGTLPSGDCMQAYKIENINIAVNECKSKLIKPELDGEFCRAWLLTEIDHWNLDKEKLILLTDNSLLVVKFDFIKVNIPSSRRIFLQAVERLQIGDLVFPPKSFMTPRNQTGIRIHFGKMSDMPLGQRWNPFSETVPFITLTNHPLFLCKTETTMHSIDDLISLLIRGIDGVRARSGQSEQFHVVEEGPILIESYAGIVSMVHNQSKLGYLNRGRSIDF